MGFFSALGSIFQGSGSTQNRSHWYVSGMTAADAAKARQRIALYGEANDPQSEAEIEAELNVIRSYEWDQRNS